MFWFLDAMLSENRLLGICLGAMFVAIAAMYFELGEKARKQGR
jgi:predicted outer membrane lipoprotein